MSYQKCKECEEYHWLGDKCPKRFKIVHEEYLGDEQLEVRAQNAELAAEVYASRCHSDEPNFDEDLEIIVIDEAGNKFKYVVTAEPTIQYYAELKNN